MIIVGLGNPGEQYDQTPHNVGFNILNRLAHELGYDDWREDMGAQYLNYRGNFLMKPWTFMNLSGPTVNAFLNKKNISLSLSDLWVIHDDLDLPPGTVKPDFDRSSGGHQGVQSVIEAIRSQAFHRLRIGIGSNRDLDPPVAAETYVLQPIRPQHLQEINRSVIEAVEFLKRQLE